MHGLHLSSDLHDCQGADHWFTDADAPGALCTKTVEAAGLQAVGQLVHAFAPAPGADAGGVTATVLLAESHLCIHTWPEQRGATIDVYVCNFGADHSAKAMAVIEAMEAVFMPGRVERHALRRGSIGSAA